MTGVCAVKKKKSTKKEKEKKNKRNKLYLSSCSYQASGTFVFKCLFNF